MSQTSGRKRVALVTGASSGLGKAIAKRLLADDLTVVAAARGVERMQDLAAAGASAIAMDVTDGPAVERVMAGLDASHGGVDVLVNNAGYGLYGAVEDLPLEEARRQFEVNLFAVARLTKRVLPGMRAKRAGWIINISSMGGRIYTPLGAWYHASKHALEGWSDCLRLEVSPLGIHVVIIEPGILLTEFGNVYLEPMLKASGDGPYAVMAKAMARTTEAAYRKGDGSPPEVIAEVISRALRSRRPRTRYAAGRYAKPMLWLRKHLGDRFFDGLVMRWAR